MLTISGSKQQDAVTKMMRSKLSRQSTEKEAKSLKKQLKEAKNEQKEVNLQSNEWNLLLVNSSYPLAADYSPELTAVDDEDHKVDPGL